MYKFCFLLVLLVSINMSLCKEEVCNLPLDVGICRGSFKMYGYDRTAKKCREFYYGGCEGNNNRFETLAACQAECGNLRK